MLYSQTLKAYFQNVGFFKYALYSKVWHQKCTKMTKGKTFSFVSKHQPEHVL